MAKWFEKAGLGVMLAATMLTAAAPAEAQRGRNNRHRGNNDNGAAGAVIGGLLGLGIGAAIVSGSKDRDRRDDRDRRNDRDRGYYARPSDRDPWAGRGGYAAGGVVSDGRGYAPYR